MPDSVIPGREARSRVGGPAPDTRAEDIEAAHGAAARSTDPQSGDVAVSVVGMLFRLAPRLMDLLDMAARDYGLGFARGRVLWVLRESGPQVMRALSEALAISPRTVTGLVDALEADGWVARSPHPSDRRATVISLTPAAGAALAGLDGTYQTFAHDLLGDVPVGDLEHCRAVFRQLERRLDSIVAAHVAATPPGPPPGAPPRPAPAAPPGDA